MSPEEAASPTDAPAAAPTGGAPDERAVGGAALPEAPPGAVRASESAPTGVPVGRAGRLWAAVIVGVVLLVVMLVFIFQNLQSVRVSFFTADGHLPLALALLFAAVLGALVVLVIGSVRILQLRRTVRQRSRG